MYINCDDEDSKDCDPDGNVQVWPPVLENQARGRQIGRCCDNVLEEVVPAGSEPGHQVNTASTHKESDCLTQMPGQPCG